MVGMRNFALAACLSLALAACATTGTAVEEREVDGPEAVEGAVGFNKSFRAGGVAVTPLALVEDSRCPADVQCVWAGRLVIDARILTPEGMGERQLTLGEVVAVSDGQLRFDSAEPAREAETEIDAADYRFAFSFIPGG